MFLDRSPARICEGLVCARELYPEMVHMALRLGEGMPKELCDTSAFKVLVIVGGKECCRVVQDA